MDMYANCVQLTYNGKKKQQSFCGGLFTLITIGMITFWWVSTYANHTLNPSRNYVVSQRQYLVPDLTPMNMTQHEFIVAYKVTYNGLLYPGKDFSNIVSVVYQTTDDNNEPVTYLSKPCNQYILTPSTAVQFDGYYCIDAPSDLVITIEGRKQYEYANSLHKNFRLLVGTC